MGRQGTCACGTPHFHLKRFRKTPRLLSLETTKLRNGAQGGQRRRKAYIYLKFPCRLRHLADARCPSRIPRPEPRRALSIGWRTCATTKPMPPPPRGGQGGSQRDPRFPRCAFLGYFLCTSKESNKKSSNPAALWPDGHK